MKTELLETLSKVVNNERYTRGYSASCSVAPQALSPTLNLTEPWNCPPLIPCSVEMKDGWSYSLGVPYAFFASRGSTVSLPFTNCTFTNCIFTIHQLYLYQLYLYHLPVYLYQLYLYHLPFTNFIFNQLYLYHLPVYLYQLYLHHLPICLYQLCLYHLPFSDK